MAFSDLTIRQSNPGWCYEGGAEENTELWKEIEETTVSVLSDFSKWVSTTFAAPLRVISEELDAILFPPPPRNIFFTHEMESNLFEQSDDAPHSQPMQHPFNQEHSYLKPSVDAMLHSSSRRTKELDSPQHERQLADRMYDQGETIEPQHCIPDIGLETQCYAYKSHAVLTIHKVQNISRIIESSVSYGEFKLKGPGFRLEGVRIPIRKGGDQIITVKFVTHSLDNARLGDSKCFANNIVEYRVDIPLSLMKERVHRNWVVLSCNEEIYQTSKMRGIMPEAVYVMQSDESNIRTKEPRMNFSLWKCMQGIVDVTMGSNKDRETQRIYVGYFDDPVDLAVANLVNHYPTLLQERVIKRDRRSGRYFIDGTLCSLSLEENGDIIVHEGGTHQPLLDYLNQSVENLQWDQRTPTSATDLVEDELLPNLNFHTYSWEEQLDRPSAMALGCHRAAIREQIAIKHLMAIGVQPPPPLYSNHIGPVPLRPAPGSDEVFMTYIWDDCYANPRLVPVGGASRTMDDANIPMVTNEELLREKQTLNSAYPEYTRGTYEKFYGSHSPHMGDYIYDCEGGAYERDSSSYIVSEATGMALDANLHRNGVSLNRDAYVSRHDEYSKRLAAYYNDSCATIQN